jgi:hypothetical protein
MNTPDTDELINQITRAHQQLQVLLESAILISHGHTQAHIATSVFQINKELAAITGILRAAQIVG